MVDDRQMRPMLTVREVADLLHIHTNTVRRWSDRGVLRAYRIAQRGDRRFRREDVARFLADLNDGPAKRETSFPVGRW
jgi:excisionase family DNA binding protein